MNDIDRQFLAALEELANRFYPDQDTLVHSTAITRMQGEIVIGRQFTVDTYWNEAKPAERIS